jgi:hypothetical protein
MTTRDNMGRKPQQIHVKPGGDVDQASKEKNA